MELLNFDRCRLEIDGPLATFVLDNPDRLNAADPGMLEGLMSSLQEIKKPRRGIRCLMITGEGRAFCAGANVRRIGSSSGARARSAFSIIDTAYHPVVRQLRDVRIPVVTAVNGPAVGFGVALALSGDITVAAESAYFYLSYVNLATAPDCGVTWTLPRRIGMPRTKSMLFRGDRVPARQARDWGLIVDLLPDENFRDEAAKVALQLAAGPTVAFGQMKQLCGESARTSLDEQMEAESRAVLVTSRTKDNIAAIRAAKTREPVNFIGE